MLTTQSQDQIDQVNKTLQDDDERFEHYLLLLEMWIDCHAFIPRNLNKQMLPIFLKNCKYNLDKTKRKLELYFVYKKCYPKMFCYREFTDMEKKAMENFYIFEASHLTPDGYRVNCAGFRSPVTTGCDMNVVNKILTMFANYKANFDVINGALILVINFQNLSPSIVSGVMNTFFKRNLVIQQNMNLFRIGSIYVTFLPGFAVSMVKMIKIMLNEKIRNRLHIEAGNEQMKKNIPLDCLPREFGGTDGTINENADKLMQKIMRTKPFFIDQEKIQVVGDIPKDLYMASGIDEHFGTQGSFRKLNID